MAPRAKWGCLGRPIRKGRLGLECLSHNSVFKKRPGSLKRYKRSNPDRAGPQQIDRGSERKTFGLLKVGAVAQW